MRVTEFTADNGETTIVVTEHQRRALERAGFFRRGGYAQHREFDGTPSHSDWDVATLLGDYSGLGLIEHVGDNIAGPFNVVAPGAETEQSDTFEHALLLAKLRHGCHVVIMQAKDTSGWQEHLYRVAEENELALLIVETFDQRYH